jgi:hypothetical protein
MSYQVGKYCYADEASAALAACAAFSPVTAILQSTGEVRSLYCQGVADNTLRLAVITTNPNSGKAIVSEIALPVAFPPCVESDLIRSWETIAGALLATWAVCYGVWKVYSLLSVNPRTGE